MKTIWLFNVSIYDSCFSVLFSQFWMFETAMSLAKLTHSSANLFLNRKALAYWAATTKIVSKITG